MVPTARFDLDAGGWVELSEAFVPDHEARMIDLVGELPLVRETVHVAGRDVLTPRLTSWHGDADAIYRYSGRSFVPAPWTPTLVAIRDRIEDACGLRFNSVLANYYRDGSDSMGAHSDDEPELGPSRDDVRIASISLGASRRFVLAHRRTQERRTFELGGGSLLMMGGTLQRFWKHHVPKTQKPVSPRLNLTFRLVRRP